MRVLSEYTIISECVKNSVLWIRGSLNILFMGPSRGPWATSRVGQEGTCLGGGDQIK